MQNKNEKQMKIHPERVETLNAAQLLHLAAASSSLLLQPESGGEEEQNESEEEEEDEEKVPPAHVQLQLSCPNSSGTSAPHSTGDLQSCSCSFSLFWRSKVRG